MRQVRYSRHLGIRTFPQERVDHAVARFRRARAYQAVPDWVARGFCAGVALDALVVAATAAFSLVEPRGIGYAMRAAFQSELGVAALLAPPLLMAVLAGLMAVFWRYPLDKVAREVDARLGLAARIATALELERQRSVASGGAGHSRDRVGEAPEVVPMGISLFAAQHADALSQLRRYEPHEAFPLQLSRREGLSLVVALVLLVVLAFLPGIYWNSGREFPSSADHAEVARAEAERLGALADELAANEDLPAEERQELAQTLAQVAQQLQQEASTPEQAMAALSQTERSLASRGDASTADRELALARLADALDQTKAGREAAWQLDRRDFAGAARELRRLGETPLSPEDRQALAEALRQAASATSRLDPELSARLAEAANAMSSSANGEQAAQAMQRAAKEVERAGQEVASQQARERALAALQDARQAVAQGERQSEARSSSQRLGSGQAVPNGPRSADGGNSSGQRGIAGDTSIGEGEPDGGSSGEGQAAGDGESGGSSAGTGTHRSRGQAEREDIRSRQVRIPTEEFEQPEILPGQRLADGDDGEAVVDYRQVVTQYRERATEAMSSRYVPPALKELVRDYFSSLDGSR